MMSWEDALIQEENKSGPKMVLIFDDHKRHVLGHLKFLHKRGMSGHVWAHLKLWWLKKYKRLPKISIEDVVKAQNKRENYEKT